MIHLVDLQALGQEAYDSSFRALRPDNRFRDEYRCRIEVAALHLVVKRLLNSK